MNVLESANNLLQFFVYRHIPRTINTVTRTVSGGLTLTRR